MRWLPLAACVSMAMLSQRASAQALAFAAPARNAVPDFVTEAAQRFSIPDSWIYAVMRVESAGDPRAVSPKGARGLMQIMPATWAQLRVRYTLGSDIYDPHDNILAGAGYLRQLYDRYGAPGFLAAYNAGPARYESYLAHRASLPDETIAYVRKLAPIAGGGAGPAALTRASDPTAWTRSALFARPSRVIARPAETVVSVAATADGPVPPPPQAAAARAGASSLFIPLSGQSRR